MGTPRRSLHFYLFDDTDHGQFAARLHTTQHRCVDENDHERNRVTDRLRLAVRPIPSHRRCLLHCHAY